MKKRIVKKHANMLIKAIILDGIDSSRRRFYPIRKRKFIKLMKELKWGIEPMSKHVQFFVYKMEAIASKQFSILEKNIIRMSWPLVDNKEDNSIFFATCGFMYNEAVGNFLDIQWVLKDENGNYFYPEFDEEND